MKKSIFTILGFVSVVVFAKGYIDSNFNGDQFMNDTEIQVVKRLDDSHVRYVASYDFSESRKINFPVNDENSNLINKVWKITNYTYNFGEPEVHNKNYKFELVGNGRIMIAEDNDLVYDMIRFNGESIRLVKEVDGGTEMIEAVSISEVKNSSDYENVEEKKSEGVQGLMIAEDFDLTLVKVENADKKASSASSAELSITSEGTVTNFIVDGVDVVTYEIKVGGLFSGEYGDSTVSGRITNGSSSGKYRVRFYTGPLKGQILYLADENSYEQEEYVREEVSKESVNSISESKQLEKVETDTKRGEISESDMTLEIDYSAEFEE